MVLLSQKLLRLSHKPPDHASSLALFRSKIADFIAQTFSNHPKSADDAQSLRILSLTGFQKCFQLIHFTHTSFAQLVAEMDYPMTRWGTKSTQEYLNYSLNLLHILNSITSSLSRLDQARLSALHSLMITGHNQMVGKIFIPAGNIIDIDKDLFKLEDESTRVVRTEESREKECVVVEALKVSKKVEFLALGFVLSGLCSHPKPYLEMRKLCHDDGFKDSTTEGLDLRLSKVVEGEAIITMEDVREINRGIESCGVSEMTKRGLKVMESAIKGVDKAANDMFYDVLGRRNKLLDNIRLTGKHK